MSTLVLYLFYKNVMMVLTQYWFTVSSTGVSGQKLSPEFGTQCFNVIWTFFPILILGVFDKDVDDETSRKFPQMYHLGIQNYYFGVREYVMWLLDAVLESLIVTFFCLEALKHSGVDGMDVGLWMTGAHTFTMVILIANFKILLLQKRWSWEMGAIWALGIAFWWPCCYIGSIDNTHSSPKWATFAIGWRGLWFVVQKLPVFWFLAIILPFMLLAPQALRGMWLRFQYPEITDLAVEVEQFGLTAEEADIKAWEIVAPAPEPVHLSGWDTVTDESMIASMSPLPLPSASAPTSQAAAPLSAPPSMVLSPDDKRPKKA